LNIFFKRKNFIQYFQRDLYTDIASSLYV